MEEIYIVAKTDISNHLVCIELLGFSKNGIMEEDA